MQHVSVFTKLEQAGPSNPYVLLGTKTLIHVELRLQTPFFFSGKTQEGLAFHCFGKEGSLGYNPPRRERGTEVHVLFWI